MKKFITCPECGYKLFKAEEGADVELTCPNCKERLEITIKGSVITTISKLAMKKNSATKQAI